MLNAGAMLDQRRRRRANIAPALGQCLVLTGLFLNRRSSANIGLALTQRRRQITHHYINQGRIQTRTNGGLQVDHPVIGGSGGTPPRKLKKLGIFGIFRGGGSDIRNPPPPHPPWKRPCQH